MKKYSGLVIVLLILICGFGSYGLRQYQLSRIAAKEESGNSAMVERGSIAVEVVETGVIDAVKSVEVKSRASGRLSKLLVDEGDRVNAGQLIAIIDPQETQLRVEQTRAQLTGAESGVERSRIELEQRRKLVTENLAQAESRLAQVKALLGAQPTLTKSAIQQAQAALNANRSERKRLVETAHPNQRTAAITAKREAEASLENAESQYERVKELHEKGYVAKREVENAKLNLDLAKARLDSANENLERLDTQFKLELERLDEQIAQSQAELARAEANSIQDKVKEEDYRSAKADVEKARIALRDVEALEQALEQNKASVQQLESALKDSERELGETEIRSPIDGIVAKKLMQEGELVASLSSFSSGTPILRIEDRTGMQVNLAINEIDTAKLAVGMNAKVIVDALPDKEFEGQVSKIAPSSMESTSNSLATDSVVRYEVEIMLKDVDPQLRSGMSAKCILTPVNKDNVLTLPVEFVGEDDDGHYVLKDLGDKKTERVSVEVGISTGSKIEIVSGITEGVEVVRPDFTGPKRKGAIPFGGG